MQQNTAEWLEFRRSRIGGSDAPIVMGISPWKTPYQLWQDKVYGTESQKTSSMQRGHDMEGIAREEFERLTGIMVMPKTVVSPDRNWQMASLDGMSINEDVIVEIKCPNREVHEMAKRKEIPEYYVAQVQHQMSVCDLDQALYFSFNGNDGVVVEVKRDQGLIDLMLEKEEKFWKKIITQEAPDLTERDYVQQGDVWVAMAKKYKVIGDQIKDLESEKDTVLKDMLDFGGEKNSKGGGFSLSRVVRKGNVNYKGIPELKGVDLEKYRTASTQYWKFCGA